MKKDLGGGGGWTLQTQTLIEGKRGERASLIEMCPSVNRRQQLLIRSTTAERKMRS